MPKIMVRIVTSEGIKEFVPNPYTPEEKHPLLVPETVSLEQIAEELAGGKRVIERSINSQLFLVNDGNHRETPRSVRALLTRTGRTIGILDGNNQINISAIKAASMLPLLALAGCSDDVANNATPTPVQETDTTHLGTPIPSVESLPIDIYPDAYRLGVEVGKEGSGFHAVYDEGRGIQIIARPDVKGIRYFVQNSAGTRTIVVTQSNGKDGEALGHEDNYGLRVFMGHQKSMLEVTIQKLDGCMDHPDEKITFTLAGKKFVLQSYDHHDGVDTIPVVRTLNYWFFAVRFENFAF